MASAAKTGDMSVDRHVIRRICEEHVGSFAGHEQRHILAPTGVTANKAVPAELPDVAHSRDRLCVEDRAIVIDVLCRRWICLLGGANRNLDFADFESAYSQVEAQICEFFEFDREDVAIPASVESQLVVGEHVCPFVLL